MSDDYSQFAMAPPLAAPLSDPPKPRAMNSRQTPWLWVSVTLGALLLVLAVYTFWPCAAPMQMRSGKAIADPYFTTLRELARKA